MIREVVLFSPGDSRLLSTWSNVPFFLAKTLEERGIVVNRIDISINRKYEKIYNKTVLYVLSYFFRNHYFSFERSIINTFLTNRVIKQATREFPNSDAYIFMSMSFRNKYSKKPSILIGDWTYEYIIRERQHRNPYFFENRYIRFQSSNIRNADFVISLFPKCRDYIAISTGATQIFHLGTNVVNNCNERTVNNHVIQVKRKSRSVLFIGGYRYLPCVKELIQAYRYLQNIGFIINLNIIGFTRSQIGIEDNDLLDVSFHGYLNKSIDTQRDLYYSLLESASVVINTTENWSGYSSLIEALYYYTPLICSPFEDFVEEFGSSPKFCYFCDNEAIKIALAIKNIIESPYYLDYCTSAHEAVRDHTWSNFVNRLLLLIES